MTEHQRPGVSKPMSRRDLLKVSGATAVALAAQALPAEAVSVAQRFDINDFDSDRSALVFIEFQNEWLNPGGVLNRLIQDRALFDTAVHNAGRIIQKARERGVRVVHAGLSLVDDPDYMIFGQGKNKSGLKGAIPKAGTWRNPEQVRFPEPFAPRRGEFVVAGRSGASVLTNSTLDPYLRNNRIEHIYLLGFALHVCVESTLRHAHDLGYEVTVISDAAPAFTAEQQAHVLRHVVHHFGSSTTTDELICQL